MKSIYDMTLVDLENYFMSNNQKKFKATQVFEWVYKKRVTSFDDMKNVGKEIINKLKTEFLFNN